MGWANKLGVACHVLAVALLGCGGSDAPTTLADIERGSASVVASIERGACSCSCGQLVCWDFTCSGSSCSRADEYELIVQRDGSDGDECLDPGPALRARLFGAGDEPLVGQASTLGCDELAFRWRGPGADLASLPHRVEIGDASASWSIDDPFASSSLTVLAPPSAISASPSIPATVQAGDTIRFSPDPPVELMDAGAFLRSSVTHDSVELPVGDIDAGELEVLVPSSTRAGLYDLQVSAGTSLPSAECQGPAFCRGVDIGTSFSLRVE